MPVYDWSRVNAGIFHDFRCGWISAVHRALNGGRLSSEYYALATAPLEAAFADDEIVQYAKKADYIAIHNINGHQVVAIIEIVSPGNKASRQMLRSFVDKAVEVIGKGVHLLVVDLFPPGPRDPQGIHQAIWSEIEDDKFQLPPDKLLTLAAYSAGSLKRAFIEPVAVGDVLPDMPLFLLPEIYVPVPLEATYQAAWEGVPQFWRDQLTATGPA